MTFHTNSAAFRRPARVRRRARQRRNLFERLEARHLLTAVPFEAPQVVDTDSQINRTIHSADLDHDGDLDLLAGSDGVYWYENTGGTFSSTRQQIASSAEADNVRRIATGDINGDGAVDVLSISLVDNNLAWYAGDGSGGFGGQQIIDSEESTDQSLFPVDLDRDGDLDVVASDDGVFW